MARRVQVFQNIAGLTFQPRLPVPQPPPESRPDVSQRRKPTINEVVNDCPVRRASPEQYAAFRFLNLYQPSRESIAIAHDPLNLLKQTGILNSK